MLRVEDAIATIPEETALVAHAAFPNGNVYLWIRDELGQIYQDKDFAELYDERGQPGWSAWRLAMVCILQFMEDLTDRQAADAVRGRIDWKYLLGLELKDRGFDYSILSEFRSRLLTGQAESILLEKLLSHLKQTGQLKERARQRTDSTHILSAIRNLNRLESVAEMLRATLNAIAKAEPEWLVSWVPESWYQRYGKVIEDYRLPKKKSERTAYGEQVGRDGMKLLEYLWQKETPSGLKSLPIVERMRQHWIAHFYIEQEQVKMRPGSEMPPAGNRLDSPYESDSRYGNKRSTTWRGYKIHGARNL